MRVKEDPECLPLMLTHTYTLTYTYTHHLLMPPTLCPPLPSLPANHFFSLPEDVHIVMAQYVVRGCWGTVRSKGMPGHNT